MRRSRPRFWKSSDPAAHATLHDVPHDDHAAARAVLPVRDRRAVPQPRAGTDESVHLDRLARRRRGRDRRRARSRDGARAHARVARARRARRRQARRAPAAAPRDRAADRGEDLRDDVVHEIARRAQRQAVRSRRRRSKGLLVVPRRPELPARSARVSASCCRASRSCSTTVDGGDGAARVRRPTVATCSTSTANAVELEPDDVEIRAEQHEDLDARAGRPARGRARPHARRRPARRRHRPRVHPRGQRPAQGERLRAQRPHRVAVLRDRLPSATPASGHRDWIATEVLATTFARLGRRRRPPTRRRRRRSAATRSGCVPTLAD